MLSRRSIALTLVLAVSLAANGVAQSAVGVKCAETHIGSPVSPWRDNGNNNGVWVAACQGTADCDRVVREHNCALHKRLCTGTTTSSTTANLTDIVADGVGRAVATLPTEQAVGAIAGLGLLAAMVNSANASNAAAARAAAQARAAEEAAARVRAEEEARKARETQEYLEKNLKGFVGPPGLQAKLESGPAPLQPKLTGAFGTNVAPKNPFSTTARPQSKRDLTTAWKQLWCASDIANKAASAGSLEDILYLANETRAAIDGVAMGEGCRAAPAVPTIRPEAVPARIAALKSAVGELAAAAEKAVAAVPPPTPAAAAPPRPAPPAATAAVQTDDEKRIAEIFRQQKDNERRIDEQIAPVREAQKAINKLGGLPEIKGEE